MIKKIIIKNFVLIEYTELEFTDNLNILIGETGGGKSLVFRAIGQILGDRAQKSYIRESADKYEIKAIFTNTLDIKEKLIKENIPLMDMVYISRSFDCNGNSKISINGEIINLKRLQQIVSELADVVLQKENNQSLTDEKLLDLLNINPKTYRDYTKDYQKYIKLKQELKLLKQRKLHQEEELLVLEHRLKEFKGFDFNLDYLEIQEKIKTSDQHLEQVKKNQKIVLGVDNAIDALNFPKSLTSDFSERIIDIKEQLEELSYTLNSSLVNDVSEQELNEMRDKLSNAKKLARKFDCEIPKLNQIYEELQQQKEQINSIDIDLLNVENRFEKHQLEISNSWDKCLVQMEKNAKVLCNKANKLFNQVEMPKAKIKFEFNVLTEYTNIGKAQINLLIDANGLNTYGNINEHASGGEFSRTLLILKVLDERNEHKLLMFDEIDTGISGYTAQKMIQLIQKIAQSNQILLITHLAQSAAAANNMYELRKNKGISQAYYVEKENMPKTISKLLSGSEITQEAIEQAKILIKEVQNESNNFSN